MLGSKKGEGELTIMKCLDNPFVCSHREVSITHERRVYYCNLVGVLCKDQESFKLALTIE